MGEAAGRLRTSSALGQGERLSGGRVPGTPGLRLCFGTALPARALPAPEELRERLLETEPSRGPGGSPAAPSSSRACSPPKPTLSRWRCDSSSPRFYLGPRFLPRTQH